MNVFCLYITFGNSKQLNNSHSWVQTYFIKIFPAYWTFVVHSSAYALTEPHTMLLLLGRTQLVATVVALLLELLWMKTENETERRSAQLRLSWSVCVCACMCVCVCVAVLPTTANCRWKRPSWSQEWDRKRLSFYAYRIKLCFLLMLNKFN